VSIDALQTALLSDAATRPIAMAGRIRPLWRGARLAGPALTVCTDPGEHPAVLRALEEAQAGVVIVVGGGGFLDRALWGRADVETCGRTRGRRRRDRRRGA
jgi:regulator of RNase E activity RraA